MHITCVNDIRNGLKLSPNKLSYPNVTKTLFCSTLVSSSFFKWSVYNNKLWYYYWLVDKKGTIIAFFEYLFTWSYPISMCETINTSNCTKHSSFSKYFLPLLDDLSQCVICDSQTDPNCAQNPQSIILQKCNSQSDGTSCYIRIVGKFEFFFVWVLIAIGTSNV